MHFFPNGAFSFCSLGAAPPDWLRTRRLGQPRAASGGRPRSHSRPGLRDAVCTPIPTSVCGAPLHGAAVGNSDMGKKQQHNSRGGSVLSGRAWAAAACRSGPPQCLGRGVGAAQWRATEGPAVWVGGRWCLPAGVLVRCALQEREGKGGHDLCVRGLLRLHRTIARFYGRLSTPTGRMRGCAAPSHRQPILRSAERHRDSRRRRKDGREGPA